MLSHVWLFVTPWTVAHHAPLSMRFSRQESWSGLPFPPPGDYTLFVIYTECCIIFKSSTRCFHVVPGQPPFLQSLRLHCLAPTRLPTGGHYSLDPWVCFFAFSLVFCIFFKIPHTSDMQSICLSLSDLFHIAQYPPSLSMWLQMAIFCSFLWPSSIPSNINIISALSIYLLMDAGCFHILATVNIAAVDIGVCIFFFWISVFTSFGCIPRNGLAGS